jgi:hypothetical protein
VSSAFGAGERAEPENRPQWMEVSLGTDTVSRVPSQSMVTFMSIRIRTA